MIGSSVRRLEISDNPSGDANMAILLDGNTGTCAKVLQENTQQLQLVLSLPTCPVQQQHQIQVTGDNMRCDEPGFLVVYDTESITQEGCAAYKPCHLMGSDTSSGQVICEFNCLVYNAVDIHLLWSTVPWYSDQHTWRVCEIATKIDLGGM